MKKKNFQDFLTEGSLWLLIVVFVNPTLKMKHFFLITDKCLQTKELGDVLWIICTFYIYIQSFCIFLGLYLCVCGGEGLICCIYVFFSCFRDYAVVIIIIPLLKSLLSYQCNENTNIVQIYCICISYFVGFLPHLRYMHVRFLVFVILPLKCKFLTPHLIKMQ